MLSAIVCAVCARFVIPIYHFVSLDSIQFFAVSVEACILFVIQLLILAIEFYALYELKSDEAPEKCARFRKEIYYQNCTCFLFFFLSLYRNNCLDLVLCFSAFFSKKKTVCVVDEHGKESILFTFNEQPILDRNNTVFAMQIIFDFAQIF